MALGKRAKHRREELGLTQGHVAQYIGVTQEAVNNMERRDSKSSRNLIKLSEILDTTPDWLTDGKGKHNKLEAASGSKITSAPSIKGDAVRMPMLGAQASMGYGITQDQLTHDEQVGAFETTKKWVNSRLSHATSTDNIRIITGMGDSMKGTFSHGDALFVDTGVSEIKVDAVYALAYDGELYIKRVQRIPGGRLKLISDNKKNGYEPIMIEHKDVPNFQVIGRVIGALNYNEL